MCNDLTRQIMLHKDDAYKALTLKLTPGLKPDSVIGVRIPILRKIAKDARQEEACAFIDVLPHDYYEENNRLFDRAHKRLRRVRQPFGRISSLRG